MAGLHSPWDASILQARLQEDVVDGDGLMLVDGLSDDTGLYNLRDYLCLLLEIFKSIYKRIKLSLLRLHTFTMVRLPVIQENEEELEVALFGLH